MFDPECIVPILVIDMSCKRIPHCDNGDTDSAARAITFGVITIANSFSSVTTEKLVGYNEYVGKKDTRGGR